MTQVRCSVCLREWDSTTVTKRYYKEHEQIDTGCPYCGEGIALLATETKSKRTKK